MKFKVGQKWKSRDGRIFVITGKSDIPEHPFPITGKHADPAKSQQPYTWTMEGIFDNPAPNSADLVELLLPEEKPASTGLIGIPPMSYALAEKASKLTLELEQYEELSDQVAKLRTKVLTTQIKIPIRYGKYSTDPANLLDKPEPEKTYAPIVEETEIVRDCPCGALGDGRTEHLEGCR